MEYLGMGQTEMSQTKIECQFHRETSIQSQAFAAK